MMAQPTTFFLTLFSSILVEALSFDEFKVIFSLYDDEKGTRPEGVNVFLLVEKVARGQKQGTSSNIKN